MHATFFKRIERDVSTWTAVRRDGASVVGATMALGRGGMPHDLPGLAVETTLGVEHGFWWAVMAGAHFKSLPGRSTPHNRRLIHEHHRAIAAAEHLVHEHVGLWAAGRATPCAGALDALDARWSALGDDEGMVVGWPTPRDLGTVRIPAPPPRRRGRPRHAHAREEP